MQYKDYSEKRINQKRLKALLSPSWLSGLMSIFVGLIFSVGVILAFHVSGESLKQQLLSLERPPTSQSALTLPGQAPPGSTNNSLQNTWPLFAFWAMVGLIVYFIIEFIVRMLSNAEEFSKQLNYVHAKRHQMITTTLQYLLLRFISLVIWLVFIDFFLKRVIPYCIELSHKGATIPLSINSVLYPLLAFVLIALCLHINVIFLRLAFRRTRLFTAVDYLDV